MFGFFRRPWFPRIRNFFATRRPLRRALAAAFLGGGVYVGGGWGSVQVGPQQGFGGGFGGYGGGYGGYPGAPQMASAPQVDPVNANFMPGAPAPMDPGLGYASGVTGQVAGNLANNGFGNAAGAVGNVSATLPGATSPSGIVNTVGAGLAGGGVPGANIVGTVANNLAANGI
jgi:hypothetical protein